MFCKNCGKNIPDDSAVCSFCGDTIAKGPSANQTTYGYHEQDTTPLSVGSYLIMWLVMAIPIANIIMLCIWAFGDSTTNINKKNFAKAQLIVMAITAVLVIALWSSLFSLMAIAYRIS